MFSPSEFRHFTRKAGRCGLEAVVGLGLLIYSGIGEPDAAFSIVGIGTACASNGGNPPELALIAGRVIPLLYGLLLLILAIYKAVEYWKLSSGLKDFLLVRVIVRDQFIYYGSVIFVSISKIADIPISNKVPFVSEILDVSSSNILLCVLGGQLLVNLKEVGEEGTDNGTDRTVSEIDFQGHQMQSNSWVSSPTSIDLT